MCRLVHAAVPWTIGLVYRLFVIGLLASLYGWITRLVALSERAKERVQIIAHAERWPFALRVEVPSTLPRLAPVAEHAVLRLIQASTRLGRAGLGQIEVDLRHLPLIAS